MKNFNQSDGSLPALVSWELIARLWMPRWS